MGERGIGLVRGKTVMERKGSGEAQVIRRDGVFDVAAAQDVAHRLATARAGTEVRVDLTQVREFHDFGVALLAQALATCKARVAVQGLRQHHLRLLRYLGIGIGAAGAAA